MTNPPHIISKVKLDFTFNGNVAVKDNGRHISDFCQNNIIPACEKLIETYPFEKSSIQIDYLELDLGYLDNLNWEQELLKKLKEQLHNYLKNTVHTQTDIVHKPIQEQHFKALLFFLRNGRLPWWYSTSKMDFLEKNNQKYITISEALIILNFLQTQPNALDRIVVSFSENFLMELVKKVQIPSNIPNTKKRFFVLLKSFFPQHVKKSHYHKWFWKSILQTYNYSGNAARQTAFIEIILSQTFTFLSQVSEVKNQFHTLPKVSYDIVSSIKKHWPLIDDKMIFEKINKHILNLKNNALAVNVSIKNEDAFIKNTNSPKNILPTISFFKSKNTISNSNLVSPSPTDLNAKITDDAIIEQTLPDVIKKDIKSRLQNPKPLTVAKSSSEYIAFAGIVLLHPFLPTLFEQLNLFVARKWLKAENAKKAVHILAYLATGKELVPEHDMVLFKHLCGLEWDAVIAPKLQLSKNEKMEADNLLKAVINHWKVLKDTSIMGLRESFFNRQGKLSRTDKGWQIIVEQNSFDILLSRLPWGIGMIKLPWRRDLIWVSWA